QPVAPGRKDRGPDVCDAGPPVVVAGDGMHRCQFSEGTDAGPQTGQGLRVIRQVAAQENEVRPGVLGSAAELLGKAACPPMAQVQITGIQEEQRLDQPQVDGFPANEQGAKGTEFQGPSTPRTGS